MTDKKRLHDIKARSIAVTPPRWNDEVAKEVAKEDISWLLERLEELEKEKHELSKEVAALGRDSVKRDATLAELEAEVRSFIAEQEHKWISVKDKLPPVDTPVLVAYIGFLDGKLYADGIAKWDISENGYNGGWIWTLDGSEAEVEITHWMVLPDAPRKENA